MRTTFIYDHYYRYEELCEKINYFTEHFPGLCSAESICTTPEGRILYAVTLTNRETGAPETKPGFQIDGNTHAGEVTGSMAAMYAMDAFLTGYGKDETITRLLDTTTVYIIPRISPDGAEAYLTTPYTVRSVNRVHNPKEGGIREEDLDQDGVIRMMRIPTPYGAWKLDENGEMTLRKPGDAEGTFYDIYPEGVLEPYDGDENLKRKRPDWSSDFNRNFPFGWFPENRQQGAGEYPLSNPETRALADWVISHPNIGAISTNHTSGGMILYPPGTRSEMTMSAADRKAFRQIAEEGKELLDYVILNLYDAYVTDKDHPDSGAFDDWCYETQGILTYTIELWDLANKAGAPLKWGNERTDDPYDGINRFNACMKWVREHEPQDYLDWRPFRHETFGDVEIGGFNYKFTQQNAPCDRLEELLDMVMRFYLRFVQALPKLCVEPLQVKACGEGLYEVTAVIGNTGYLPTFITDHAAELEIDKHVKVTLEGAEILSGKACTDAGNLSDYSRTVTGPFAYGNYSTMANAPARKKLTWIVRAPAGTVITVQAEQEKSGRVEASAVL